MTIEKYLEDYYSNYAAAHRELVLKDTRKDHTIWREAEMARGTNTLERPFICKMRIAPKKIYLRKECLVWREDEVIQYNLTSTSGMLMSFVRLGSAPPEAILKFARKWGVLGLPHHSIQFKQSPYYEIATGISYSETTEFSPDEGWDPLRIWRHYSRQARSILRIAANFHQNKQGDFIDWKVLHPDMEGCLHKSREMLRLEKTGLEDMINGWLQKGRVRLEFEWRDGNPSATFACTTFGALACQLMFTVCRSQGLAICSSCHHPYLRGERVRPKQRNYCKVCGTRAKCRDAKAAQRDRQRLNLD